MRLPLRLLIVFLLGSVGFGQQCLSGSPAKVQIRKLLIESPTLPDADRRQVIREFQHHTYYQHEISIRIQYALRNRGYAFAVVDEPTFSHTTANWGEKIANVTVKVNEGERYRLGSIEFLGTKLFPANRLRNLFPLQDGDLFNASKFGIGLQNLQNLYLAAGYAQVAVVPTMERNEQSHTVDLTLDVQQGFQYYFGHLILDGLEPHAGAGQSLLNSWKSLQGKQYSPSLLQQWLVANRSDWQAAGTHTSPPTSATRCGEGITEVANGESRVVNIKLSFPEN